MEGGKAKYVLRCLFVRHAQSENNSRGRSTGGGPPAKASRRERAADPAITELGRRQAEHAAVYLQRRERGGERITRVYTSCMTRALQTAAPVVAKLPRGTLVELWPQLHEAGGCFRGERHLRGEGQEPVHGVGPARAAEILGAEPAFDESHFRHGGSASREPGWWPGGYEEEAATARRATGVVARLAAFARSGALDRAADPRSPAEETIVVIVHGKFFNTMLRELLHVTDEMQTVFMTGNCAMTSVDLHASAAAVVGSSAAEAAEQRVEMRVAVTGMNQQHFLPEELQSGHSMDGLVFEPVALGAADG